MLLKANICQKSLQDFKARKHLLRLELLKIIDKAGETIYFL